MCAEAQPHCVKCHMAFTMHAVYICKHTKCMLKSKQKWQQWKGGMCRDEVPGVYLREVLCLTSLPPYLLHDQSCTFQDCLVRWSCYAASRLCCRKWQPAYGAGLLAEPQFIHTEACMHFTQRGCIVVATQQNSSHRLPSVTAGYNLQPSCKQGRTEQGLQT